MKYPNRNIQAEKRKIEKRTIHRKKTKKTSTPQSTTSSPAPEEIFLHGETKVLIRKCS